MFKLEIDATVSSGKVKDIITDVMYRIDYRGENEGTIEVDGEYIGSYEFTPAKMYQRVTLEIIYDPNEVDIPYDWDWNELIDDADAISMISCDDPEVYHE